MGVLRNYWLLWRGHICELDAVEYAIDGMDGADRQRAEAHLQGCAYCREMVREVMGLQEGLAQLGADESVPEGLADRVVAGALARAKAPRS
jgi:predicted anti-sigma-YlaC factor YlaD